MARIGFIGVGMMGHGMARNLLAKGHALTVMAHRNRAPVEDLLTRGARETSSAAELARTSDAVFLCVTGSPQVEELVCGAEGILAGAYPGLIVIDTSTSRPASTRHLAALLAKAGAEMVDSPVTGGPPQAAEGKLLSLVGCREPLFAKASELIAAYSARVERFGGTGAGHTAKLINNFITMSYVAAIVEGYSAGAAAGVDLQRLYGVMTGAAGDSGVLRKMIPPVFDGDLTGHRFAIRNGAKDVGYFRELAEELGTAGPTVDALLESYQGAIDAGYGDRLMASLLEYKQEVSGQRLLPLPRKPSP